MKNKKYVKSTGITYYCLILDESSSMSSLTDKVKEYYCKKMNDFKETSLKYSQAVIGNIIYFSDRVNNTITNLNINQLTNPKYIQNYRPCGYTALLDAIGKAINICEEYSLRPQDAVIIEIITDGQENSSVNFNWSSVKNLINKYQKTEQWTFIFQGPVGSKSYLKDKLGLQNFNINEWETTETGWIGTVSLTSKAMNNYMSNRSLGHTHTTTFYKDVNLDKLSTKDIKQNLNNLSSNFKILKVDKEYNVSEFVESKIKKPLVVGSVYYQLTKPELIRKGRQILVMEKNKNDIWGGQEAYNLLGLPTTGNVQVTPNNLSKFDIFIESRSNNRKLVRGTKVLFDKTKKLGETPTWHV